MSNKPRSKSQERRMAIQLASGVGSVRIVKCEKNWDGSPAKYPCWNLYRREWVKHIGPYSSEENAKQACIEHALVGWDDEEAVTEEWLDSVADYTEPEAACFMIGSIILKLTATDMWMVQGTDIIADFVVPKTRGAVRNLCSTFGKEIK